MAEKKHPPQRSIWRIALRKKGAAAGHYAETQRQHRPPAVGEILSVRISNGSKLAALVESVEAQTRRSGGVMVYALEVAELDQIGDAKV